MRTFLDIATLSLNRQNEELCGDQVKILRTRDKTTLVLSDGLGSGVKASILSTLTTEILITMLRQEAPLHDVLETVVGTLPTCKVRKLAYATFTIIEIFNDTNRFRVTNFDNPAPFFVSRGKVKPLAEREEVILGKKIRFSEGVLERGDFLGMCSDGVLYAGLGNTMNFGWGWDNVAAYIESIFSHPVFSGRTVVNGVIAKTRLLYQGQIGDDAAFTGVYARDRNSVMVFTGPPQDECHDYLYVERLLDFEGRKVVCGGTTGNIVAACMHKEIVTDITTLREDVPPVGHLPGINLLTEGIITLSLALENLRISQGNLDSLTPDGNGAYLLTRELLLADEINFLVGRKINPFYQSPTLPKNISIRDYLIERIASELEKIHKEVSVEYC